MGNITRFHTVGGDNVDLPQRKRTRLQGYDYSQNGAYFVTICTQSRCEILSDVCRGGALLRPIGMIAEIEIHKITERFHVLIDKHVIMPNHIHLITVIERAEQSPAPTANRQDNALGRKIWQRSYHDHIIRNEQQYQKIWEYIDTNPLKWAEDCFYNK